MSENLYCKGQLFLSEEGKANWDNIEWGNKDAVDKKGQENKKSDAENLRGKEG